MAYVIVQGRGLSGALHGGPGLAVRGGMQRGMRDGMGPTFPLTQDGLFREPAQYTQTNGIGGGHGHGHGHHGGGHGGRGRGGWGPVGPWGDGIIEIVDESSTCPPGFLRDFDGRCIPDPRLPATTARGGLSGPLKLTIEHLGGGKTVRPGQEHVRNGLRGLGDSGQISDGEARQRLDNLFASTCQSWIETINQALDDMPVVPVVPMQQARSNLRARRDQITSQVLPSGISVIEDTSLSLDEVTRRVSQFLAGFLDVIKLDISNAQQDAKHGSMLGQLQTLVTAMGTVTAAAVKAAGNIIRPALDALPNAFPAWVPPLAIGLAVLYVIHELR